MVAVNVVRLFLATLGETLNVPDNMLVAATRLVAVVADFAVVAVVALTALAIKVLVLMLNVPSPNAVNPVPNLIPPNTTLVAVETGPVGPCGPVTPVLP